MSWAGGTVAGRLSATGVAHGQRAGEQFAWELESADEFELALAEAGGLRAFGANKN